MRELVKLKKLMGKLEKQMESAPPLQAKRIVKKAAAVERRMRLLERN